MARPFLIFARPQYRPGPWLQVMCALELLRFLAERAPLIRQEIADGIRERRREERSMCAGCRFYPGDGFRRGERERSDELRVCLAGQLMEFHLAERHYGEIDPDLTGWRKPGCHMRERGVAEPEPDLPPRPWFTFHRRKWGTEVRIEAVSGCWSSLNRELDWPPSIAEARLRVAAYARRNGLPFVEAKRDWA